ncbi:probable thioredoxin domain-containing protein 5 [Coccomyxa sp. Obi]|nr:probable thioredoxin domain-containing protein 5 [Coccomyxa sp. Obi]
MKGSSVLIAAVFCTLFIQGRAGLFDHSNVVKLDSSTFNEKVADGKVYFIKFFAPWCGHCKKLAPTWSQLADSYKDSEEVVIAQVDCTKEKDVCEKAEVTGYPSLKSYYNGESHATFRGGRTLEALQNYVDGAVKELTLETVS